MFPAYTQRQSTDQRCQCFDYAIALGASSEKMHSNVRKMRIPIFLRMRKVSSGPLLSIL